jgi:putative hydrolase of the HAD superfamily
MIRAVLFDFDGTLAQFSGDRNALSQDLMMDLGLRDVPSNLLEVFRAHEYAPGLVTLASALRATLEELQLETKANLDDIAAKFIASYAAQIKPLPDALETLRYFAHLPKAILTNGPSDVQRAAIRASTLEDFFETILVSGDADVGFAKPHPRIFELACERLEVAPIETLMIGDNLELDVRAAMAVGLQAIHKTGF